MSDPGRMPWSNDPYAPQIPYRLHVAERINFTGNLISAALYGIVVVLFFQCTSSLFDPVHHTERGVKWPLVAHTVTMFFIASIMTVTSLYLFSISSIDNRGFPGDDKLPPGPFGYIFSDAIVFTIPNVMFLLNNLLSDGLLLYRCFVIHARSNWAIAFPCLMYLASIGTGILSVYANSQPESSIMSPAELIKDNAPYFAISVSLNLLLTLMIVVRLILYRRNIKNAMGGQAGVGGLYKTIATIMVESSALYAITYLLFIGSWAADISVQYIFLQALGETQVIAPFLITLRVANRSALTSETVVSGNVSSLYFGSQGKSTVCDEGTLREDSTNVSGDAPGTEACSVVDEVSL